MSAFDDIQSVADLESKLGHVKIPWEEIAPDNIQEWLDTFAKSRGTSRDLLLAGILPCTGALIGDTTVKLFDSLKEKGNLFFVGLAPSGAGKTPACNMACVEPLISHLEPRIQKSILVDSMSTHGLFNHFQTSKKDGERLHVPLLCIDEGYSFLHSLISSSKSASQASVTMERLCKLYDGDYWYCVKGQGKRVGVQSARMSMVTFTTPRRFLTEIWPKVIAARNGLADRMLVVYQERATRDMEDMEAFSTRVEAGSVKGLGTVYEQIYVEHHQEQPVEYTLSLSARELYYKYCKGQNTEAAAAGAFKPECNAKSSRNAIRLALILHVIWHRLDVALQQLTGPTPRMISETTMSRALALHDALLAFGGIAEAVRDWP